MALFNSLFKYGSNTLARTQRFFASILFDTQIHSSINPIADTLIVSKPLQLHKQEVQGRQTYRRMAKATLFKAYDVQRKKLHTITTKYTPTKITSHRINRQDWAVSKAGIRDAKNRKAKKKTATKSIPRTAIDVLRYERSDWRCQYCKKTGDDPDCDSSCYKKLKQENFLTDDAIDIKGPGKLGYSAFTAPDTTVKKGQYLGEYIGYLKPTDHHGKSMYCVDVPRVCVIDAERAGNWTRFINSCCDPNVTAWWACIGKRHVIVFKARRDIGPEEELTFNYGSKYFKNAGLRCECSSCTSKHLQEKSTVRRRRKPIRR